MARGADVVVVTVRQAARALDLSPSTVRRDVQRGCGGILRPGESGRGRGALLDLDAYRAWRAREHDPNVLELVADVLARTVREDGGNTRALRMHAAYIAVAVFVRAHQALTRREPTELPAKLRSACAVFVSSIDEVTK